MLVFYSFSAKINNIIDLLGKMMHNANNKLLGYDEQKLIDLINDGSMTSNLYPYILLLSEERKYKMLSQLLIDKLDFLPNNSLVFDKACANGSIFILEQLYINKKLEKYTNYRLPISFLYACYYNQLDVVNFLIKHYTIDIYNYNHQAIRIAGNFINDGITSKKPMLQPTNSIINLLFKKYYLNNLSKFMEIPKKTQKKILNQLDNALLVSYSLQKGRKSNE